MLGETSDEINTMGESSLNAGITKKELDNNMDLKHNISVEFVNMYG